MTGDKRLEELQQIGVPRWLMDIAGELGVDTALTVWRRLSDESGDDYRMFVPRWSKFMRYQRNRFIVTLASQGVDAATIRTQVRSKLGEQISLIHIERLIRKSKKA